MRVVDPDDLDQLATLLDGRRGVLENVDEAFARASRLGVTDNVAALKPMRSWAHRTAPDLRRRAAIGRLENGDHEAGLTWAGFGAKDIAEAALLFTAPDVLLLANFMASSDDTRVVAFRRKKNESIDDWVDRLRAHALASIPGLGSHEKKIQQTLGIYGDITGALSHGGAAIYRGHAITRILIGNSIGRGWLKPGGLWASRNLRALSRRYSWLPSQVGRWSAELADWNPAIRSIAYPGSWLPSSLSALGSGSRVYTDANRIPFVSTFIGRQIGAGFDCIRRSRFMTSSIMFDMTGNKVVDFLVGSDRLASMYGGLTHSGAIPARAAQASLWKIGKGVYQDSRLFSRNRLGSLGEAFKVVGKAGGFLRATGVVGGIFSTAYSGVNLYKQGNPDQHFGSREEGGRYIADWAELGFNASSTMAVIAPNQYTVGATVVTGATWVGAKAVEHWDDIARGARATRQWIKNENPEVESELASGAHAIAKVINPMNAI
ncbi:PE-PGRS family protein [Streptomyces sp. NBC_00344]|uniref:PE-PGRS family protein n=1 Tax=Streptomyces sp. NBC_00344 TaxID=2975720 RepID=UPI002E201897